MPGERERVPDALNQALQEFLSAQPELSAAPSADTVAGTAPGPAKLPPNAVHGAKRPTREEPSLREAYDTVLKDDAAKKLVRPEAPPSLWQRSRGPLMFLVIATAAAYVWFGSPPFLREPEPVALPVPRTGVSAQRQMAAIALEIEDFHRNTSRLPTTFADLGLEIAHVRYRALPDGRFELSIGSGPHTARFRGSISGVDSMEAP